ncbi:MAG: YceI family protein [Flavobacteriaceae bacterium]|nr:YceI family protein [Flavobacteriaceae bacterium]
MKKIILLLLLTPLAFSYAQVTVNEAAAKISFLFIDDDVDGTISDFNFTGNIDPNNFENSNLSGSVVMETLDTNNWFRDRHLRAKKYFNAKDFPQLSFQSSSIIPSSELGRYKVSGTLTIKGISKLVEFIFSTAANNIIGQTNINTSNFDIFIHKQKERNEVEIQIEIPFSTN